MRRVILAIVSTAIGLVFLLSFKTHTQSALGTPAAAIGTPAPGGAAAAGTGGAAPATDARGKTAKGKTAKGKTAKSGQASGSKTVTGQTADTFYGPVQVKITVSGGKITAVTAVQYPMNTPRDYQINSYAIPALNQETLAAGSASIDSISGATYTSQGYIQSLQSAVDQARL